MCMIPGRNVGRTYQFLKKVEASGLHTIKKDKYPEGPWTNEPDNGNFIAQDYWCEIIRSVSGGHLCGYIHIPKKHIVFSDAEKYKELEEIAKSMGGFTFNNKKDEKRIVGFDCAHCWQFSPFFSTNSTERERYVTFLEVGGTLVDLARFLKQNEQ